jgi:hypothetical protein
MSKRRATMSQNDGTTNALCAHRPGNNEFLDHLDAFVAAPHYMVCDECNELIPVDEFGFNYDHNCLDPQVIREAYASLKELFASCECGLDMTRSTRSASANEP